MTNKLTKGLEVSANVAIIIVAVLLGVVLVRQQLLGGAQPRASASQPGVAADSGAKLMLPGVDWAESKKTLVLAVSSTCHFCTESAPFYQRLVKEGGVRLIAVVPQDAAEGRAYLDRLNVPIGDVRQMPLGAIGVEGTPTLMLVDDKGVILNSWVGKLPTSTEDEVLSKIG
jgi:thiol-disulfide isomerase/thioredoxin